MKWRAESWQVGAQPLPRREQRSKVAGLLPNRKGKAALIALTIGLLSLSLAPTVAVRPGSRSLTSYAGLRPDWMRLPTVVRPGQTPSPTATQAAPATPEQPGPVLTPAPTEPESLPTVEAPTPEEPPTPTETIAIAGVSPPAEAPPSATAAAPPAASPTPSPGPVVTEGPDLAFAEAILALVNEERLANGLNPLAQHPALVAAAEEYADLHAHLSPDRLDHRLNGSTLSSRVEAEGYTAWTFLAENLVWSGFDPPLSPAEVVQQWLASPTHRNNLLNPSVGETGIGCYVSSAQQPFRICVQDFGARA